MLRTFAFFAALLLLLLSCEEDRLETSTFYDNPTLNSIAGTWKVVSYEDYKDNTVITKTTENSMNGAEVIISFNDTGTPLQFWGVNTTNQISGTYEYSPAERTIQIISLDSSEINQPEWGDRFSEAIHKVRSYKVNEQQLRLYYNNRENSITLVRQ
ncbi:hypothetical protein D770_03905 [Flammeovirgaceae bacterium 311]|nr:hypothetical protein D770_03905 [Flammeovirgaceae bacterium 311]